METILGILVLLVIFGGLGGLLFLARRERKGSAKVRPCPSCGGENTRSDKSSHYRFSLFGMAGDSVQIPPVRRCDSCGILWRPACSFAMSIMTVVAGLLVMVLAIGAGYSAVYFLFDDVRRGDRLTLGVFIVWFGFGVSMLVVAVRVLWHGIKLVHEKGRPLEILSKGNSH